MKILISIIALLLLPVMVYSAVENLDEVVARKSRLPSASFSRSVFEGASPSYFWQPETLNYTDVTTGNEVWRLTFTPTRRTATQDIGSAHWSANGKRLVLLSDRQNAARPTASANEYTWFTMLADGSKLRPAIDMSNMNASWAPYPAWNPALADIFYATGWAAAGGGRQYNTLYANTIADDSISFSSVVSVDSSVTRRLNPKKGISSDGQKMLFTDVGVSPAQIFVADLVSNTLITPTTGYSGNLPWDVYWGDTGSTTSSWHDQYVAGPVNGVNGIWSYVLQTSKYTWWRTKLTGSGTGNQPTHTQDHSSPYVWGDMEPVNTDTGNDPWSHIVSYLSHFTPDRWGKYGIHTKTDSPYGPSLLDMSTHDYWNTAKRFNGSGATWFQHHDWSAWSDWSVSSGGEGSSTDYRNQNVLAQNYKDPVSQKYIASGHSFMNNGGTYTGNGTTDTYYALLRPTQSPDGTKAMFNSTMFNTSDLYDQAMWAVAYYPYPPEIKSAAKVSSNVRLTWDFNQGSSCSSDSQTTPRTGPTPNFTTPRTYATRGWPHETLDCPPSPREIKQFRVWVSTDNSTWLPAGTTTYNNCSGTNECGMWTETAWTYDYAQANSTTRYYSVTSLEHSGLESRTLGNVWKVITDGSGAVTTQVQQTAYPADPGEVLEFYTTVPDEPTNAIHTYKLAPATADGQYTIEWTAPADKTLVRHYNIYAKDGSDPALVQQARIASIPATAADTDFSFVDWLGNPDGTTHYSVTSVDYQGNESGTPAHETGDAIAPATTGNKSGRYTTSQTVTLSCTDGVACGAISYCLTTSASCTPSVTYSAPFSVLKNIATQTYCVSAVDTSDNEETAHCYQVKKQRRR